MDLNVENQRIKSITAIQSPLDVKEQFNVNEEDYQFIQQSRNTIENILSYKNDRLIVIVGPCSIHDYDTAIEYATLLTEIPKNDRIFPVMRVYFEKPRTTVGWKGFIYDPDLDDTNNIQKGLFMARKLLVQITKLRVPIAVEFLDTITPQYLSDLVSWGAIGARTAESQIHRQLASGLSMPIGFKNLTDGNIQRAIDGIKSAQYPHTFLGIDDESRASIVQTEGNPYAHLILRGGSEPNYMMEVIKQIPKLDNGIIIDCSHGNSKKDYVTQVLVAAYLFRIKLTTNTPIVGIMIESNLNQGSQSMSKYLKKGVSITDGCLGWDDTKWILDKYLNYNVLEEGNLDRLRGVIRYYDDLILNSNFDYSHMIFTSSEPICIDQKIRELTSNPRELFTISNRLSISEHVAITKFKENPSKFLFKNSSILELITNTYIEHEIINKARAKSTLDAELYLYILELSKQIQISIIEKHVNKLRIGYLYGLGTFSHEAVSQLYGKHYSFESIEDMVNSLQKGDLDYILIPTSNTKIGQLFSIPDEVSVVHNFSIPINMAIYTNQPAEKYDVLYVQEFVDKEVRRINIPYNTKILLKSTKRCIQNLLDAYSPCLAIGSRHLENSLLIKLEDIVDHNNRTDFTICK